MTTAEIPRGLDVAPAEADVRKLVRSICADAASQVSSEDLWASGREGWDAVLEGSPLEAAHPKLACGHPRFVLAHSLLVADQAVDLVLREIDDPYAMAVVASRILATSLYAFTDPTTGKVHRNVGAAKRAGTFFTPGDVALVMAEDLLRGDGPRRRVLDPAAGSGILLAAVLVSAAEGGRELSAVEAWELSPFLARSAERILVAVRDRVGSSVKIRVQQCNTLDRFESLVLAEPGSRGLADAIILNPPYGRIKFTRDSMRNAEALERHVTVAEQRERRRLAALRSRTRGLAHALGVDEGTPDLQRFFVAGSLEGLTPNGRLVMITPSSWTSGRQSAGLRTRILQRDALRSLRLYPESSGLFDTVNQPTTVATIDKANEDMGQFEVVEMDPEDRMPSKSYFVHMTDLDSSGVNPWRIPLVGSALMKTYGKIAALPKLGQTPWIKNARGELDLTLDKSYMTEQETDVRLVRGDHVERYALREAASSDRAGFVRDVDGLLARPKGADISKPRIVGRQVSYLGKGRRLSFTTVPPGVVVANSCNYLTVAKDGVLGLHGVLALLNSAPWEWWFRVHSSNNHVANYEIDDLPLPTLSDELAAALDQVGRQLLGAYGALPFGASKTGAPIEDVGDALAIVALGLSLQGATDILTEVAPERAERVAAICAWVDRWGIPPVLTDGSPWPQHGEPTLSALDREMIQHVPQGGNWQDIPESVPSKRLDQIREMTRTRGVVRTTYYGRLRPDQPSYTISTYFNRPGNGTNIHPYEDRTLTAREAARLQSFPDWYVFMGGEGAVRRQIGNAVPPLLGAAVGQKVLGESTTPTVIDLFAGAGGLSLGLEAAGANVLGAVDVDIASQRTYEFNRACESVADPRSDRTLLMPADLSTEEGQELALAALKQKLSGRGLTALVGGPPCQGFSHAGWRERDDERNELASVFLDFAAHLQPSVLVLENVEGLLTYERGRVVRDLMTAMRQLGYKIDEPWVLAAEQFGVPQMRRRVFLVASRDHVIAPPTARLQKCRGRRERPQDATAEDYPFTVAEALLGLPALSAETHASRGSRTMRSEFSQWAAGLSGSTELEGLVHKPGGRVD